VATIGCANLRMKQGRGDDYIPVTLTSSNSGWHRGWFYLRNDPEHALPLYTGRTREDAQVPPGSAWASSEGRDHLGEGGREIPCPRCCAAPEAATPALRHDRRQGPMGWDGYRTRASIAARGSTSRGASDWENDLLMAVVADAPDAPQCGNGEVCKLSVFSASLIRLLSWEGILRFDLSAFLLLQLKCAYLVRAKAPLPEEAIFN
jgi:hypothetical protein